MAKTVKVSIIVDDDGTMRLTERSAQKLGAGLDKVGKSARNTDRQLKGAAQASSNSTKNFSKQAQGISGGLVPAYATLAAQIFAVSAAFSFLKSAGSLEQLKAGQEAYFSATGQSTRQLTQNIIEATNAQLSFTDAAQAASIGLASGLNAEQVTRLGKAASEVSQILGRDLTDSFNRLVRGVTKAEPELLDELGIVLRLATATENYKRSLNIQGELTQFQRSQAVTAEVLSQVEEKYSRVLAVVGESPNEFAQLAKSFDDIILKIKEFSVAIAGPIVNLLKEMPGLITIAFAPFAATVITTLLPNLDKFGDTLRTLSKSANNLGKKVGEEIEELEKKSTMAMEPEKRLAKAQAAAKKEVDIITSKHKLQEKSLLLRLQKEEKLTTRQLQSIRRQAERELGIYKTMNAQKRADLIKTVNQLIAINKAGTEKIAADFGILGAKVKSTFFGITVSATGAFATIAAGAATTGAFIAGALSFLSWVALLATLGAVAYAFFFANEAAKEQIEVMDTLSEKVNSASKEIKTFAKVQNILYEDTNAASKVIKNFGNVISNIPNFELFSMFNKEGEISKGLLQEFNSASMQASENLKRQGEARPILENINELLEQQKKAASEPLITFTRQQVTELQRLQKDFKEITNLSTNFIDVLADGEKGPLKAFGLRLQQERDELQALSFTALRDAPAVVEFLSALNNVDGSKESIVRLQQARKAFQDLGSQIETTERLRSANEKSTADYFSSFYPQTEAERVFTALKKEREEIQATGKLQGFLDDTQKQRLKTLQETIPVLEKITTVERSLQNELSKINVEYTKGLLGATKLQQEELTLEKNILTKKRTIAAEENKIKSILNEIVLNSERKLQYEQADEEGKKRILALELEQDQTKKTQIENLENSISLQEKELAILERQAVAAKEIADNAFQSFESNLQKGISDLIKGAEKSFKDFALNVTLGVLNTVADTLAKQLTSSIVNFIKPKGKTIDEKIDDVLKMTTLPKQIHDAIVSAGNHIAQTFGIKTRTTPLGGASQLGPVSEFTSNPLAAGADPLNLQDQLNQQIKQGIVPKKGFFETLFGKKSTGRTLNQEGNDIIVGDAQDRGVRTGGIFSNFISDFSDVFDKNSEGGFLEKLGRAFSSFGEGLVGLFKSLPDLLGGLFKGFGGFFGGIFGAAAGGIMPGGVTGYANGGIVKRPTLGLVGEGKMNEAVVPLPDGKAIPVSMNGAGQNNNVTVNVSMDSQGNSQTDSQSDGQQGANLGKLIAGAVQEELQRQKRPGGILSPYGAA